MYSSVEHRIKPDKRCTIIQKTTAFIHQHFVYKLLAYAIHNGTLETLSDQGRM